MGVIYWVLAARYYSTEAVGLNSAAISAFTFLAGLARLNLGDALIRFIPRAGSATPRLVGIAYFVNLALALLVSLIFIGGLSFWSPALGFLGQTRAFVLWFTLTTMTWCIFTLQDTVLTGLRQTVWVAVENTVFAITKLALLIGFAPVIQRYGIFASWTIAVAVVLFPTNLLIFRWLIPKHVQLTKDQAIPLVPGKILKYVAGSYLGSLFALASTTLMPIIVTQEVGASANAYFYQPWLIITSLQFVTQNMTTSFTVEAAGDEKKLRMHGNHVLVHTTRLLLPAVIILLLGARYILSIFGNDYANEGATLLRLLALAAVPNIVNMLYLGVARVQRDITSIIVVQGLLAGLVLGLSDLLLDRFGITGVGIAYLASQSIVAVSILSTRLRPILRGSS